MVDGKDVQYAYLWLGLAAVATLAVPPFRTVSIDHVAGCTLDGDAGARERDQRAFPLLVPKAGGPGKGNLGFVS